MMPCRHCHFDVPIDDYRDNNGYCGLECEAADRAKHQPSTTTGIHGWPAPI